MRELAANGSQELAARGFPHSSPGTYPGSN